MEKFLRFLLVGSLRVVTADTAAITIIAIVVAIHTVAPRRQAVRWRALSTMDSVAATANTAATATSATADAAIAASNAFVFGGHHGLHRIM
jgi:hypothetical protein